VRENARSGGGGRASFISDPRGRWRTAMSAPQPHSMRVDGAELYCESRGTGPVLLLIAGGNGDATAYQAMSSLLSDRFTIVTYDRRGFSRSTLDRPPNDAQRLELDTDDARLLIERYSDGPAYVFGSSSGAIVALNLLTRHSSQIRRLVAHEPPIATLLSDSENQLAVLDHVYTTYRASGAEEAMREFSVANGIGPGPTLPPGAEHDPRVARMLEVAQRNFEFWLEHELRQYPRFVPDMKALGAVADRLVLAGGRDSQQYFPYRPNTVLGQMLHLSVVNFPGGHVGYATHPRDFASQLANVLLRT